MNAVMTWYAVSLAITARNVGTAIVTRDTVIQYAPLFVALLVWLTRILFIGSISVTADRALHGGQVQRNLHRGQPVRERWPFRTTPTINGGVGASYADDLLEV